MVNISGTSEGPVRGPNVKNVKIFVRGRELAGRPSVAQPPYSLCLPDIYIWNAKRPNHGKFTYTVYDPKLKSKANRYFSRRAYVSGRPSGCNYWLLCDIHAVNLRVDSVNQRVGVKRLLSIFIELLSRVFFVAHPCYHATPLLCLISIYPLYTWDAS